MLRAIRLSPPPQLAPAELPSRTRRASFVLNKPDAGVISLPFVGLVGREESSTYSPLVTILNYWSSRHNVVKIRQWCICQILGTPHSLAYLAHLPLLHASLCN
ncbi:PREDICTED: uncharacterized protein LOC105450779 isoform X2 [Wasmannia auropunctata]|uniref:uncharacterized protein LOC105450779 isoform X2 n=1 Tax=Wasmannia auropunctata TaxID=64793 RepID=UPI0005EF8833|nr:PREDICTED: uncharacterized protein LOC105450779 isoform X2 [Wasmannia auropunctata]